MSGFWDWMLGRRNNNSANKAKERLQVVLIHDRIRLSPEVLQEMKAELLAVISKYVSVASEDVEIALEQRDRNQNKLIAEIPFSQHFQDDDYDIMQETQPSTDLPGADETGNLPDPPNYDEPDNADNDPTR